MSPLTLAACLAALAASLSALWLTLRHLKAEAYAEREQARHLARMGQDAVQADAEARLAKAQKALDERVARLELSRLGR